jgi:hypothetical protein
MFITHHRAFKKSSTAQLPMEILDRTDVRLIMSLRKAGSDLALQ